MTGHFSTASALMKLNDVRYEAIISADGSEVPAMMKLDVIGNVFRHWPLLTQFTIYHSDESEGGSE